MNKEEVYDKHEYLLYAREPVHIGSGDYQLGSVDNKIVREKGSNCPYIPASSLMGAARTYCGYTKDNMECAGISSSEKGKENCGQCEICFAFGYTKEKGNESRKGLVTFTNAQILLFPVYTNTGPAWITSPRRGRKFIKNMDEIKDNLDDNEKVITSLNINGEKINLSWLQFEIIPGQDIKLKEKYSNENIIVEEIEDRIIVVSDKVFSRLVNSNLEVRTSVAINPVTGTAEDQALFTYEAIPRTTIFEFSIIFQNLEYYFENQNKNDIDNNSIKETVTDGINLFEVLGIGGMTTKGFGRVEAMEIGGGRG